MYGFIGCFGDGKIKKLNTDCQKRADVKLNCAEIDAGSFYVTKKSVAKFQKDKVLIDTESITLVFEGVLYNAAELRQAYSCAENEELLLTLYTQLGPDFVEKLNGVFSFVLYNKAKETVYLYTSHLAFRPMYYSLVDGQLVFSTDICWMYNTMRDNGIPLKTDRNGAYSVLSYGYMLGGTTLVQNINKVESGTYIQFVNGNIQKHRYWDCNTIPETTDDYDTILQKADELFCKAVDRVFGKDVEYGYHHICTLSGGLDSKSVAMVANERGFTNQLTITMGQSGLNDAKIASQVAGFMGAEHIQYDLDNGNCFKNIDKAILGNGGNILFSGFLGTSRMCELFHKESFGLLHGGEIGDAVFGGSAAEFGESGWNVASSAFSKKLVSRVEQNYTQDMMRQYRTGKLFFLMNRGVNGAKNSWIASNEFTESASPFVDKDFITYMLSVPQHLFLESKLYIDWMKRYHPDICRFIWTKTNARPDASKLVATVTRLKRNVLYKVFKKQFSMNPYEEWYSKNSAFRDAFDDAYNKGIALIKDKQLSDDCKMLYTTGTGHEKIMVLTLLKAISVYGIECDFSAD